MARFAQGPKGQFFFGCSKEFQKNPLELLTKCQRDYGDVVQLPLGVGFSIGLIFNPEDIERVFHGNEFGRSDLAAEFEPLAGGSMIIADGDAWRKQRRSVVPSFAVPRLKSLSSKVAAIADAEVTGWIDKSASHGCIDLQESMVRYAMNVLSEFLFGFTLTNDESKKISKLWTSSLDAMNVKLSSPLPVPLWLPTSNNVLLKGTSKGIRMCLKSLVLRSQLNRCGSFVDSLFDYRCEITGEALAEDQIVNEVMGVFLAGFDTVASGMLWTLLEIAKNPDWQNDVRSELIDVDSNGLNPKEIPITDSVFQEASRLWPSLWLIDRKAKKEVELSKNKLPAGINVITSPWVTHRNPDIWSAPDEFRPERFLDQVQISRPKYAHFPFGGGRMKCIGIGLTYLELTSILRSALSQYELNIDSNLEIQLQPAFVLRSKEGVPVNIRRRNTVNEGLSKAV